MSRMCALTGRNNLWSYDEKDVQFPAFRRRDKEDLPECDWISELEFRKEPYLYPSLCSFLLLPK